MQCGEINRVKIEKIFQTDRLLKPVEGDLGERLSSKKVNKAITT